MCNFKVTSRESTALLEKILDKELSLDELRMEVKEFATPSNGRGFFEVGLTLSLFFSFLVFAGFVSKYSALLAVLLGVPTGLLLVRIFVLQHDCGHRSLFAHAGLNLWIGRFLALLSLTPFSDWRRKHHVHHQHTGQLDVRRHEGTVWLCTTTEFSGLSLFKRLCYRLYHFPPILH